MKRVNKFRSDAKRPSTSERKAQVGGSRKAPESQKNVWFDCAVNKAKDFTTEELNVPCVEVVKEAKGKVFAGPYYLDQLELLRDTLRGMPKRERYVVFVGALGYWIYRKPSEAAK